MFALATLLAAAVVSQPRIAIDAPESGWTTRRVITLKGKAHEVQSPATLVVNGVERPLPIDDKGRFEAVFALGRGENAIEAIGQPKSGAAVRDAITLYARVPRVDLQVLLFWDTDQTDVDLHIEEPGGEVVMYSHRESQSTGGRLDRDDTDGYGPEIYSVASAPSGPYKLMAHYFGSRGTGQTTATVVVVAREGTNEERRWRFVVPLTTTGSKIHLATIDLPPPGVRFGKKLKKDGGPKEMANDVPGEQ